MEMRDELLGSGSQPHLIEHVREDGSVHSGQSAYPLPQGGGEVEFSAHRPLGDVGDLFPCARVLRDELDDLLLDERGVHVHDQ